MTWRDSSACPLRRLLSLGMMLIVGGATAREGGEG
jgi:hypothetical protein